MTLGALVTIVVIVLGALQLPRLFKTKAGGAGQAPQPPASPTQTAQPPGGAAAGQPQQTAAEPVSTPQTPQVQGGTAPTRTGEAIQTRPGSGSSMTPSLSSPSPQRRASREAQGQVNAESMQANPPPAPATPVPAGSAAPTGQAGQAGQPAQGAAEDASSAKELEELEDRMTPLESRAGAVKDSVDHLRQQQEKAGYSLRQDISASESSMEQYMSKAEAALNAKNPQAAKKYMDLAEREVEKLEQFFGR